MVTNMLYFDNLRNAYFDNLKHAFSGLVAEFLAREHVVLGSNPGEIFSPVILFTLSFILLSIQAQFAISFAV